MNDVPREDKAVITKGEMLRSLVESDGWKVAKDMLDERVNKIKYVSTIDTKQSIEDIGKEAFARIIAINMLQSWFNDIQGAIEMYYEQIKPEEPEEDDIIREIE